MSSPSFFERTQLAAIADGFIVAVAVSLPWSVSATSILLGLWLITLIPTLSWKDVCRQVATPLGGLPVLLFLLGAIGVTWADVTWQAAWGGLSSFLGLLVVPLLIIQFSRPNVARRGLIGFLMSCSVVLIASYVIGIWPDIYIGSKGNRGVPVKSYIVQSLEFAMCGAVLWDLAMARARTQGWKSAAAPTLLAIAFFGDIIFVTTGRTTLVVIPVLIVAYGFYRASWKGVFAAAAAAAVLAASMWVASPNVRDRVRAIYTDLEGYEQQDQITSQGMRLDWWKTSIRIIASAPLIGHGTGSIPSQFEKFVQNATHAHDIPTRNPHNQTFAIGIQLGVLGIVVLWAMWTVQLAFFFRSDGEAAWIGLVVVTANIVGSLFNSLLFDFTEGWIYVVGLGLAAAMAQLAHGNGQTAAAQARSTQRREK